MMSNGSLVVFNMGASSEVREVVSDVSTKLPRGRPPALISAERVRSSVGNSCGL
jgi:hypothetical protein